MFWKLAELVLWKVDVAAISWDAMTMGLRYYPGQDTHFIQRALHTYTWVVLLVYLPAKYTVKMIIKFKKLYTKLLHTST